MACRVHVGENGGREGPRLQVACRVHVGENGGREGPRPQVACRVHVGENGGREGPRLTQRKPSSGSLSHVTILELHALVPYISATTKKLWIFWIHHKLKQGFISLALPRPWS